MIHVVADAEGVAVASARLVVSMLQGRARQTEADLTLVLSGGSTPRRLYEALAAQPGDRVPWRRVELFWGDERCVPATDLRSNYGMVARTGLLNRPVAAVYPIPTDEESEAAALAYEATIKMVPAEGGLPRFDLILLGLGEDGHTASLFAGSPGLTERGRWVVSTEPREGVGRLTLAGPVLANARSLLFMVSGETKAGAVRSVLSKRGEGEEPAPPARALLDMIAVKKKAGWESPRVTWVLDRAAAVLLPTRRPRLDGSAAPR
jgi:6-phosphogluconolactonase